jgi:hypothetical protein
LVSTGPRSLMPTTSMSVRPDSAMARKTLRPMRPNPLIPTRMDFVQAPLRAGQAGRGDYLFAGAEPGNPWRPPRRIYAEPV